MKMWRCVLIALAAVGTVWKMSLNIFDTASFWADSDAEPTCQTQIWDEPKERDSGMVKVMTVRYVDLIYRTTDGLEAIETVEAGAGTKDGYGGSGGFLYGDASDLERMACAIYKEAGGDACSDETRVMVGNVILNRYKSPDFPDSIEAVLLQYRQYNTFYWTGIIWPETAKNEPDAVARAYECAAAVLEGKKLLPDDVVFQAEFPQGSETVAYRDGLYFCR